MTDMQGPGEADPAVHAPYRCPEHGHEWVLMRNAAEEEYQRCLRCSMLIWS